MTDQKLKNKLLQYPHLLGHKLGYTKLTKDNSEFIKYIWYNNGLNERLIQAHRGSYKSTSICVIGIVLFTIFNPNKTILICREEFDGARAILKEIAKAYETTTVLSIIKSFYGIETFNFVERSGLRITLPMKTKASIEGSIEGRGIGGSITGRHYDRIHTDDIVTRKDRYSKKKREETKRFYLELKNVLNPGGVLTHSGTPWHKDDAFSLMPPPRKYPIGSIKLKDFTDTHIKKLREGMPPSLFATNYLLKHIADEDRLFNDATFGDHPADLKYIGHLDAKYRGKDTMAYTIMAKYDKKIYARGWMFYKNIELMYDKITTLHNNSKAGSLHMETNSDKGLAGTEFRKRDIVVFDYHEKDNKHVKILAYLFKHWKNIIWDHDTDMSYIQQIIEYQEGEEPDDAPDSAASALRAIRAGKSNAASFYLNQ